MSALALLVRGRSNGLISVTVCGFASLPKKPNAGDGNARDVQAQGLTRAGICFLPLKHLSKAKTHSQILYNLLILINQNSKLVRESTSYQHLHGATATLSVVKTSQYFCFD